MCFFPSTLHFSIFYPRSLFAGQKNFIFGKVRYCANLQMVLVLTSFCCWFWVPPSPPWLAPSGPPVIHKKFIVQFKKYIHFLYLYYHNTLRTERVMYYRKYVLQKFSSSDDKFSSSQISELFRRFQHNLLQLTTAVLPIARILGQMTKTARI